MRLFSCKGFNESHFEYMNLIEDMGMDSINFITLIVEIEKRFNIIIPDDTLLMENFKSINDIILIVEQQINCKSKIEERKINAKT